MISFNYLSDFKLKDEKALKNWVSTIIKEEGFRLGFINYIFCDDEYLLNLNKEYLNHDTYTDVIGFDYSVGKELQGDIYISADRVRENAIDFKVEEHAEMYRVMVHGLLHFCGYKDKGESDRKSMRERENHHLSSLPLT